jgi:hypothetical protein
LAIAEKLEVPALSRRGAKETGKPRQRYADSPPVGEKDGQLILGDGDLLGPGSNPSFAKKKNR